jgi:hypothetical protein
MSNIKTYNEKQKLFGVESRRSKNAEEIYSLKAGQYWSLDHDCGKYGNQCGVYMSAIAAANRYFGSGNYTSTHTNGTLGVLRR